MKSAFLELSLDDAFFLLNNALPANGMFGGMTMAGESDRAYATDVRVRLMGLAEKQIREERNPMATFPVEFTTAELWLMDGGLFQGSDLYQGRTPLGSKHILIHRKLWQAFLDIYHDELPVELQQPLMARMEVNLTEEERERRRALLAMADRLVEGAAGQDEGGVA